MRAFVFFAFALFTSSIASAHEISKTSRCGPSFGFTCKGSGFGNCCSKYFYCGSGCNPAYGTCNGSPSRSSSAAPPTSTKKVSQDARCGYQHGSTSGATCLGFDYGNCCSQYSYCGTSDAYCGTGCQAAFGKCSSSSSSSRSVPTPSSSTSSSRTTTSSKLGTFTSASLYTQASSSSSTSLQPSSSNPATSSLASSSLQSTSSLALSSTLSVPSSSSVSPTQSSSTPSASPSADPCSGPYLTWSSINPPNDNTGALLPGAFTNQQCCQACQALAGCTYWQQQQGDTDCIVFAENDATDGNRCPAGIQTVQYISGAPAWGPGPCGQPARIG